MMGKLLKLLGIIFLLVILIIVAGVAYILIADPFNIKSFMLDKSSTATSTAQTLEQPGDKHPYLSAEQEAQLEQIGIDPAKLPTELSAEQQECLIKTLSPERAAEIINGATPTALEAFKALKCL